MITFKTDNFYNATSICDSNCKWSFKVVKRTAKRVTLQQFRNGSATGETFVKGVNVVDGVERCYPLGTHSMAPSLCANRISQNETTFSHVDDDGMAVYKNFDSNAMPVNQ